MMLVSTQQDDSDCSPSGLASFDSSTNTCTSLCVLRSRIGSFLCCILVARSLFSLPDQPLLPARAVFQVTNNENL
jgi:hypothetical protein